MVIRILSFAKNNILLVPGEKINIHISKLCQCNAIFII